MADPLRPFYGWQNLRGKPISALHRSEQIEWQDPLQQSTTLIGKYELRVWFEPKWHLARLLARRFPHCVVFSIPEESDTPALHRTPSWHARRDNKACL